MNQDLGSCPTPAPEQGTVYKLWLSKPRRKCPKIKPSGLELCRLQGPTPANIPHGVCILACGTLIFMCLYAASPGSEQMSSNCNFSLVKVTDLFH